MSQPGAWPEPALSRSPERSEGAAEGTESTLTLTAQDMIRFGLDPGENLVGATLELTLTAVPFPSTGLRASSWETRSPDTVIITHLSRSTEVQHHYSFVPPPALRLPGWLRRVTPEVLAELWGLEELGTPESVRLAVREAALGHLEK